MANGREGSKGYHLRDLALALCVVGAMFFAIYYFSTVPALKPMDGGKEGKAPDIAFELPSGKKTSLSREQGRVILINFWASWCGPCMEEMPSLRMLESHFAQKGFALFAFNIEETKESMRGIIPQLDLPDNLIFNFSKEYLRPYNISAIPQSILIDRNGQVADVFSGPRQWMDVKIIREIEDLLK